MSGPAYPFDPRSNRHLAPGQFWDIPLSDGRCGCGVVVAVPQPGQDPFLTASQRTLLAGVLDWVGDEVPHGADVADAPLLNYGMAHIKTIRDGGGLIRGRFDLSPRLLVGLQKVSHRGGGTVHLYEGARRVRPATADEAANLPTMSTWGYGVATALAERRFVDTAR